MLYPMCRVKIKGGIVTGKELYYNGSISIDPVILNRADIIPGDMVDVLNLNNGARVSTYVIEGASNTGEICLNGPAARWFETGDEVVILSTCLVEPEERKTLSLKVVELAGGNKDIKA